MKANRYALCLILGLTTGAFKANANGFESAPDDFPKLVGAALNKAGIAKKLPSGDCKTTKLYRGCELEYAGLDISITGPMGQGPGTEKILVVAKNKPDTESVLSEFLSAVIAVYTTMPEKQAGESVTRLFDNLKSDGQKGVVSYEDIYFSLMRVGNDWHFHAIRDRSGRWPAK